MPSLRETQALFWAAIRWPTGVSEFLRQCDPTTRAHFDAVFAGSSALGAVERVEVYANAYFWRLFGVLESQFATVAWRLGHEPFNNLVTDYVLELPSTDPDLARLGERFADFIARHRAAEAHPELPDIARVERARVDMLDAPDHPVATVDQLRGLPPAKWPSLAFGLSPAMTMVDTGVDVSSLWQARVDGTAADEVPAAPTHVGAQTIVWRRGHAVIHRAVPVSEARALACAAAGGSFVDLCAAAAGEDGDEVEPAQVVAFLQKWLGAHLIAEVRSKN